MLSSVGFAIAIGAVSIVVVLSSRATQRALTPDPNGGAWIGEDHRLSTRSLYLNVGISQLLVAGAIVGITWVSDVGWESFGDVVPADPLLIAGAIGFGTVLYLANDASVVVLDRLGVDHSDDLRGALAPTSPSGWALLLLVVLPVIAAAEELLFRAALIGGLERSLGVSPWILVAVSAVLFAVGHGIQGAGGIAVTGALGAILGGAFVVTSSLLFVVVAHYVVNALEFVIHEAFGVDTLLPLPRTTN